MSKRFSKVAAGLASLAIIAGVASFTTATYSDSSDNKSVIKVAQANDAEYKPENKDKTRKSRASK